MNGAGAACRHGRGMEEGRLSGAKKKPGGVFRA